VTATGTAVEPGDRAADGQPILHMTPAESWARSIRVGRHEPPSLADEGFIHCTHGWAELVRVGQRHYRSDPRPYLVLTIDPGRLTSPLRYDDQARIYPHIYGPLNPDAVVDVVVFPRATDGTFLARTEASMTESDALIQRLEAARRGIDALRPAVEHGEPWPVEAIAAGSGESEWSPTEVLAHVSEMLLYWKGEMERVLAGPTDPTPFGRVSSDPVRSLTVVRDATLPARELYGRIDSFAARYVERLPELTPAELARTGMHPARGLFTVPGLVERFAVSHLEEHVEQLRRTLGG
jgi:uncharacterized protein (DUF952 family)